MASNPNPSRQMGSRSQPAHVLAHFLVCIVIVVRVGGRLSRTTRTFLTLAFARLLRFGFFHLPTAASGSLLVCGNRLDHPARNALVTGQHFNHVSTLQNEVQEFVYLHRTLDRVCGAQNRRAHGPMRFAARIGKRRSRSSHTVSASSALASPGRTWRSLGRTWHSRPCACRP
jgi:hypothetical protein